MKKKIIVLIVAILLTIQMFVIKDPVVKTQTIVGWACLILWIKLDDIEEKIDKMKK